MAAGRHLASLIRGAEFVQLPSRNTPLETRSLRFGKRQESVVRGGREERAVAESQTTPGAE